MTGEVRTIPDRFRSGEPLDVVAYSSVRHSERGEESLYFACGISDASGEVQGSFALPGRTARPVLLGTA